MKWGKKITFCSIMLFSLYTHSNVYAEEITSELDTEVSTLEGSKVNKNENIILGPLSIENEIMAERVNIISSEVDNIELNEGDIGNHSILEKDNNRELSEDTYVGKDVEIVTKESVDALSEDKPLDELKNIEYTSFYTPSSSERYHLVKAGDSLWGIATKYGITLNELMEYNNFPSLNVMIHPGDRLIVSIEQPVEVEPTPPNSGNNGKNDTGNESVEEHQYYTIVSGDSLWRIANKHNLSIAELIDLNGFKSSNVMIHPGQRLIVGKTLVKKNGTIGTTNEQGNSSNTASDTTGENSGYYTISAGDSLWKIANQHGMTVDELLRLNGFSSASVMIHPGQKLKVKELKDKAAYSPTNQDIDSSSLPKINTKFFNRLSEKRKTFICEMAKYAIDGWNKYHILPSITIGQAITESMFGESKAATIYNNYFGIYQGNRLQSFSNMKEAVERHGSLLNDPRYVNVAGNRDYKSALINLYRAGYASAPNYVDYVSSIISEYDLQIFDEYVLRRD